MKVIDWTHLHPKYAGKWVAFADDEETVIGSAKTLPVTIKQAQKKGHQSPLVFKVPREMLPYVGAV